MNQGNSVQENLRVYPEFKVLIMGEYYLLPEENNLQINFDFTGVEIVKKRLNNRLINRFG